MNIISLNWTRIQGGHSSQDIEPVSFTTNINNRITNRITNQIISSFQISHRASGLQKFWEGFFAIEPSLGIYWPIEWGFSKLSFLQLEKEWPIILQELQKVGSFSYSTSSTKANLGLSTRSCLGNSTNMSWSTRTLAKKPLDLLIVKSSKEKEVSTPLAIKKIYLDLQYSTWSPWIRTQHWVLVIFIIVRTKTLRRLGERFQEPTPKTLRISSKRERKLIKSLTKRDNFPRIQWFLSSNQLFVDFPVNKRFISLE